MENVKLTINGKEITAPVGSTILEAARRNGIYIPTLCYDEAVEVYGACGLCVVEAQGVPKLLRSCSAKVSDGMVINTESERVVKSRKIAMELLMSAHDGDCIAPCQLACPANTDCQGYVGLIANGEFDSALKLIKKKFRFLHLSAECVRTLAKRPAEEERLTNRLILFSSRALRLTLTLRVTALCQSVRQVQAKRLQL